MRRLNARKGEALSASMEKRHQLHPTIYIFTIIILVVVVVTFVALPMGGRVSSGSPSIVFGHYNGGEIAYQQGNFFAQEYDLVKQQTEQSAQNVDTLTLERYEWYEAYTQTIYHTAILQLTQAAGMQISSDKVDKALLSYPAYLDNGKFSEQLYLKTSLADRVRARREVTEQLLSNQFNQDILEGPKSGDAENQFIAGMAGTERSFSMVSFPFSNYPLDELKTYAQANMDRFRKIKVSRILVKTSEADAQAVRKKLVDKTGNFEDLAKTYSKDSYASNGGDMGWQYSYDLETDFANKDSVNNVFALKAGEISAVLKGNFGWMIYRCDAETVKPDVSDQGTIDAVKAYVLKNEKGKVEDYFTGLAGKLTRRSSEIGFAAAAQEAGAQITETDYFPVNLQNVFNFAPVKMAGNATLPSGLAYNEDFFFRAFSLGKDQASAPIVLDDQIVVLKLKDERPLPQDQQKTAQQYATYVANQSLQSDILAQIDNPARLRDNFDNTFEQLYKNSATQSQ